MTSSQQLGYGYDIAGRITTIGTSANGSIDTILGYGPLGNVATRTTSAGTSTDRYNHDTRLLGIDEPIGGGWRFPEVGGCRGDCRRGHLRRPPRRH